MSRWRWLLSQLTRRLWVRATALGLLGVVAALLAMLVERFIPWPLPTHIGAPAVESILNIIATSMLAVTTFSLSVMTAAYSSATNNATPRATKLLMEDQVSSNVLSTFLGSFLFSVVGIVVLKTQSYGERGRFVLFVITIAVIVLIVVALLRWIDHLTRLGRVGETTNRVEQAAHRAIQARLDAPYLGGKPLTDPAEVPAHTEAVLPSEIGYVQHVDIEALQRCADDLGLEVYVLALPGTFVYPDTVLARVASARTALNADSRAALAAAFTLGNERSFDQDPRFGLTVLAEIGSRALSPATNDPGTAIDVIHRLTRLLCLWSGHDTRRTPAPDFPSVSVPSLATSDLFEDAFLLLARDGAGLIEIQLRLRKSLEALCRLGPSEFRAAARDQIELASQRAEQALTLPADKSRLRLGV